MKFIDELYNMYRDHLTGDEEDLDGIVMGILEGHNRLDLEKFVGELDDESLYEMISIYLRVLLLKKEAEEGIGENDSDHDSGGLLH
ncbi:DUF6154 family protein [Bacillus taeanensis]|uniref:Cytosolic protein n=1 Tax=Bacillus taeanensis TaxID=273032 RepID=A0A366XQJ9_9BACI|nr:DUF6154 family protein [Bacillus taeanensis]RBW67385.1 hypothetical protein DS031_22565 [Bacillus taeanensis]